LVPEPVHAPPHQPDQNQRGQEESYNQPASFALLLSGLQVPTQPVS
jgi:hypothetical protein